MLRGDARSHDRILDVMGRQSWELFHGLGTSYAESKGVKDFFPPGWVAAFFVSFFSRVTNRGLVSLTMMQKRAKLVKSA